MTELGLYDFLYGGLRKQLENFNTEPSEFSIKYGSKSKTFGVKESGIDIWADTLSYKSEDIASISCISGDPDDSNARLFYAKVMHPRVKAAGCKELFLHVAMLKHVRLILERQRSMEGGYYPKHTVIVVYGMAETDQSMRLEVVRDIANVFHENPIVYVVGGIDPFTYMTKLARVPASYVTFFSGVFANTQTTLIL
jgi:hypothetical protein